MNKQAAFSKITERVQKGLRENIAGVDRELAKYADKPKAVAMLTKMKKRLVSDLKWYERHSKQLPPIVFKRPRKSRHVTY
jgi:hypothetical protein